MCVCIWVSLWLCCCLRTNQLPVKWKLVCGQIGQSACECMGPVLSSHKEIVKLWQILAGNYCWNQFQEGKQIERCLSNARDIYRFNLNANIKSISNITKSLKNPDEISIFKFQKCLPKVSYIFFSYSNWPQITRYDSQIPIITRTRTHSLKLFFQLELVWRYFSLFLHFKFWFGISI